MLTFENATFSKQDHLNDVRINEAEIDWLMIAGFRNPLVFHSAVRAEVARWCAFARANGAYDNSFREI